MATILCTGISEDEFRDDLRLKEVGIGTKPRCYSCKRQAGEQTVSLMLYDDDKNKDLVRQEVKLIGFEKTLKGNTFQFPVCLECSVFLGLLDDDSES